MGDVEEIRKVIKDLCLELNEMNDEDKPVIEIYKGATGSAAGLPFEIWFKEILSRRIKYEIFERLEFMRYIVENYLLEKTSLKEFCKNVWYGEAQQFTRNAIARIKKGKEPKLQQTLGDIILKYGKDLNDVILLNVKATEIDENGKPVGRAPNIVSAYRLLKFLANVYKKIGLIDKINVWLVGFYYLPIEGNRVQIRKCYFRDLFKLDLNKAPPINFDAAIQIQWHLNEMVEDENQTLDKFAIDLGKKYLREWENFREKRDEKIKKVIDELFKAIEMSRKQRTLL
ncbi:MAG: HincII family type II restriction endonuclease [Candidatus Aenigmatarchaeota archaeon]